MVQLLVCVIGLREVRLLSCNFKNVGSSILQEIYLSYHVVDLDLSQIFKKKFFYFWTFLEVYDSQFNSLSSKTIILNLLITHRYFLFVNKFFKNKNKIFLLV